MTVKLSDGFEVNVEEKHFDDWNLLKLIRGVDKGEYSLIVDVAEILLGGEENVDRLAEHLAVDGVTSIYAMADAVREIMDSVSELKNSSPSPA